MNSPSITEIQFAEEPEVSDVPGPRSQELRERQQEIESQVVTYPRSIPIALDEALGATIRDVDGNVFIDFYSGAGVLNVGHSNPYVLDRAQQQTEDMTHTLDFPSEARIELTEALNTIAPGSLRGSNRIAFCGPSGSDAIEATRKLAIHNGGSGEMLAFRGGNHGQTVGALTLSGVSKYKKHGMPLVSGVEHLTYPYPTQQDKTPEAATEEALADVCEAIEDPYSGIIDPIGIWVEPIQGSAGVITPQREFLVGLREIADEHGIPLIFDEVQTGFGRTADWFASDIYDVTPDVIAMGKAIGSGFPLAGIMFDESLDTWDPGAHKGTFRGFAPAMSAGAAAIEYIRDHDLLSHSRKTGQYIRSRLDDVVSDHPCVTAVRGKGLMIGVEFDDRPDMPATTLVDEIQRRCYERGLIIFPAGRYGNVLRLLPPLVLTERQAEVGTAILVDAIDEAIK